jgi:hypothetical protein
MSRQNLERFHRGIEAFNARDIEGIVALCHPEVEFHSTFAAVGGGVYHGHDGLRRWHQDLAEVFDQEIGLEPEEYFDLGEHTLAFHVMHGRGKASGAAVSLPIAQVVRWHEDGVLAEYIGTYANRDDALNDLGLVGEELKPISPVTLAAT